MTNFEFIAKDENTLANWMSVAMDCDLCPDRNECIEDEGNSF